MLRKWLGVSQWPIACVVTDDRVQLAQLHRGHQDSLEVVTASSPLNASPEVEERRREATTAAIRSALSSQPFSGRHAITCLGPEKVSYRHVRLAPMPDSELATAVPWHIAEDSTLSVEQIQCDYLDVGMVLEANKPRREIIAVSAATSDIQSHVDLLAGAELSIEAIDATATALARCIALPIASLTSSEPRLIVSISSTSSNIMVVRHGLPFFIRTIASGCAQESGGATTPLKTEPAITKNDQSLDLRTRELIHHITSSLHYLSDNDLISTSPYVGCLIGAGRHETDMVEVLNRSSTVEFHPLLSCVPTPIRSLLEHSCENDSVEAWVLPLGLAIYGHENFIRGMTG